MGVATLDIIKLIKQGGETEEKERKGRKESKNRYISYISLIIMLTDVYNLYKLIFFPKISTSYPLPFLPLKNFWIPGCVWIRLQSWMSTCVIVGVTYRYTLLVS